MNYFKRPRQWLAKKQAETYQGEIDSIRAKGEYKPNVWQKVARPIESALEEGALDVMEFFDSRVHDENLGQHGDLDEIRTKLIENEKAKALKDYEKRGGIRTGMPVDAWLDFSEHGSYFPSDPHRSREAPEPKDQKTKADKPKTSVYGDMLIKP